jgi:cysteine sulfinate desulfinase/cysteine desulfurase-like protein
MCVQHPKSTEGKHLPTSRFPRGPPGTTALAAVAGLVAAVKLARAESREIQSKSPRARSIISNSITIARIVVEASKAKS